jgi:hypothetical protein
MSSTWPVTKFTNKAHALAVLTELLGKRWLCRGQATAYRSLVPSIDRKPRQKYARVTKLALERQSIDVFRSIARFFADQGEKVALTDDTIALMVLRHYGVPTRLLDWSLSPFVAAYFAVHADDKNDGEIWSFDHDRYAMKGNEQWAKWPETTTDDGTGTRRMFVAGLTAFTVKQPPDWFVCGFYRSLGFPRQDAQNGAYSMTARFGRDHSDAIADLLSDSNFYHRYVVPAKLKSGLRRVLREQHGIWRGSLFPDSAGAAETAATVFSS